MRSEYQVFQMNSCFCCTLKKLSRLGYLVLLSEMNENRPSERSEDLFRTLFGRVSNN